MPVRATKRGADRTPLSGSFDVVICGASFAGLAAARELAGSGAAVLVVDRYEIGERQTSACAAPTDWLTAIGAGDRSFSVRRARDPHAAAQLPLAAPVQLLHVRLRELCRLLWQQCGDAGFETATVSGRTRERRAHVIHTDRGDLRTELAVDALGWRRVLSNRKPIQPPNARLSRGLEVHPGGASPDLEVLLDAGYVRAGYSWSFPAGDEVRVGVGSFDPRAHVKEPTVRLAGDRGLPPEGFQGNWIPHQLRAAIEDDVFFAGDSAGHCLPATAEGIRPALFFGALCGRELRAVLDGARRASRRWRATRPSTRTAAARGAGCSHQRLIGAINRYPAMTTLVEAMSLGRFVEFAMTATWRSARRRPSTASPGARASALPESAAAPAGRRLPVAASGAQKPRARALAHRGSRSLSSRLRRALTACTIQAVASAATSSVAKARR